MANRLGSRKHLNSVVTKAGQSIIKMGCPASLPIIYNFKIFKFFLLFVTLRFTKRFKKGVHFVHYTSINKNIY